jgi:hypothetical protein
MTANVGALDPTVRIIIGLGLVAPAATGYLPPWGYIGVVPLATGLVSIGALALSSLIIGTDALFGSSGIPERLHDWLLRGGALALTISLVLTLPETHYRKQLLTICFGVEIFTIVFQGLLLPRIIKILYTATPEVPIFWCP